MTTTIRDWTLEKNDRNRPAKNPKGFEVVKFITNGEYRKSENLGISSEHHDSVNIFKKLGKDVQIVIVKCAHNSLKHHFFAFGSEADINRPLYRQAGKHIVPQDSKFRKFAIEDGLMTETDTHYYDVWHDWQSSGHGWTDPENIAIEEVKKYRRQEAAKQRQVEAGDNVEFHANQAWREGMVLATIEKRALIAYRMPAGAVYMVLIDHNPDVPPAKRGLGYRESDPSSSYIKAHRYGPDYQSISANALKKNPKWMAEVQKFDGFEDGNVEQGLRFLGEDLE